MEPSITKETSIKLQFMIANGFFEHAVTMDGDNDLVIGRLTFEAVTVSFASELFLKCILNLVNVDIDASLKKMAKEEGRKFQSIDKHNLNLLFKIIPEQDSSGVNIKKFLSDEYIQLTNKKIAGNPTAYKDNFKDILDLSSVLEKNGANFVTWRYKYEEDKFYHWTSYGLYQFCQAMQTYVTSIEKE